MYFSVGIAGRGWLPVRCPDPRPLALAVHTGSVPLATILRVFRLVPGHQGGDGGAVAGGGGGDGGAGAVAGDAAGEGERKLPQVARWVGPSCCGGRNGWG